MARGGDECHLPLVAFPDTNEVICAPQVQLGEDAGPREFPESGGDQGKWIREFHRLGVQSAIVNAWLQAPVLLAHEEET